MGLLGWVAERMVGAREAAPVAAPAPTEPAPVAEPAPAEPAPVAEPAPAEPAPKRLVEAAGVTVEEEGWTRLTGQTARDLKPMDQARMQQLAYHQWEANGLSNRLIELPLAYLLAEGVKLSCPDAEAQTWLDAFWKDPITRLNTRLEEHVRAYKLLGELCWTVHVNPVTGHVRLGYVDPVNVERVVKDPENPALEIGVVVRIGHGQRKLYRTVLGGPDEELLGEGARRLRDGMRHGQCFYWRRNALPNSSRGRSDLLSKLDTADVYEQLLFGEVERAAALRQVVYDVEIQGATEQELEAKARTLQTPRPLSTRVRNEREKWNVITPSMQAGDATETARLIRGHALGASTLPEHWFGIGGDVNRATAGEMSEPTFKVLTAEQLQLKALLEEVGRFVLASRITAIGLDAGRLMELPEYEVTAVMPDLASRDVAKFTAAFAQAAVATIQLVTEGLLTRESALSLLALIAQQMGLKLDVKAELDAAEAELAGRAEQDVFSLAAMATAPPTDGGGGLDGGAE